MVVDPSTAVGVEPGRNRLVVTGIVATLLVHAGLGLALAAVEEPVVIVEATIPRGPLLCDGGRRCAAIGWHRPRLGPETERRPSLDVIEASVVPRLGHAEKLTHLPRLWQYAQAERVEAGVNVSLDNPPTARTVVMAIEPKKRRKPRRHRKGLASILDAPISSDPRRRPTGLEDIIGRPDGDTRGRGTEAAPAAQLWAGRAGIALKRHFKVPASIDDAKLAGLKLTVAISKVGPGGEILRFTVGKRSGDPLFDTAAMRAVQLFSPGHGGSMRLPAPSPEVLAYVNSSVLRIVFDGGRLRK